MLLVEINAVGGIGFPAEIHLAVINVIPWSEMGVEITAAKE